MDNGPLNGFKVLDMSRVLAGPVATVLLADQGAEVIKVEKIGGEDMRKLKPTIEGESLLFALLNRGKKSVEIDLKDSNSYSQILHLIKKCDVFGGNKPLRECPGVTP